ncbi:GlsB/YeaQ/YmgE family stress response membrane protein [Chloroflexales bacterium ZM16-3]|nr:GlsB/YeaQ/YmgE family stress response membrane protein [Chloroflexales bacterium ZM16-3]
MSLISWVIFGGLAGWIASMIAGTNARQGCLMNIAVGIVGAMIGGAVFSFLFDRSFNFRLFSPTSFVVAVIGSLILLGIVNVAQRRR